MDPRLAVHGWQCEPPWSVAVVLAILSLQLCPVLTLVCFAGYRTICTAGMHAYVHGGGLLFRQMCNNDSPSHSVCA